MSLQHASASFLLFSQLVAWSAAAYCGGNTATTRSEWCDYSIDSDYTQTSPETGMRREFWLELTDVTLAPDGVSRTAMAINGSIPGPTLMVDWGDDVVVHVTNSLTSSLNGTSLHHHGIVQNYTNQNDGVASITQCPTPPGSSYTYTWKATQYGSTWLHSHFALQAWQGIFCGLVINGPATANYDHDLGMLFLNDWDHQTVDELYEDAQSSGPPTLDTGLINGTNVWEEGGYRYNTTFVTGTSYRIRLVNAAVDTHFKFSMDNHTMQVIAADLNPIQPYDATVLDIGMGQRYDIVVTADQAAVADSFWIRAVPQSACSENSNVGNIRGIIYYDDSTSTPNTTGYDYTDTCDDETDKIVPYIAKSVGDASTEAEEPVAVVLNSQSLFRWTMNSTSMLVEWADPTLQHILQANTTFEESEAVVVVDDADVWVYFIIETDLSVPHPIHLHGMDQSVLAQGTGSYNASTVTLNLSNPPRRDTVMLPASGYVVVAFETNNPGAWLMHCHIGWHTSEGFALQLVERAADLPAITDQSVLADNCAAWTSFADAADIEQHDSGV